MRKAPISFVISAYSVCLFVRLAVCISVAPIGRISLKFGNGAFYKNLSRKSICIRRGQKYGNFTWKTNISLLYWCLRHTNIFAIKPCCATLNIVILLTVTSSWATEIGALPQQQWLRENTTILCYSSLLILLYWNSGSQNVLRGPKGSETNSKRIRGCISLMDTLKFS